LQTRYTRNGRLKISLSNMADKAKREPNPFDFCPKHKGFYQSCGCDWKKGKKTKEETEVVEEPKSEDE